MMYLMTVSNERLRKSTLRNSLFHQFVHLIILHSDFSDNLFFLFLFKSLWKVVEFDI